MGEPKKKTEIEFIPFVHPDDSKGKRVVRHQVRRHVARFQHERPGSNRRPYEMQSWSLVPGQSGNSFSSAESQQNLSAVDFNPWNESKASNGETATRSDVFAPALYPGFHYLQSLPPVPAGSTQEDPFWTYPIPYSSLSSRMIAHYVQYMTQPVPELDGPQYQGLLRSYWFPLALRCPASLYAVLLVAASQYRLQCEASGSVSQISERDVLYLKACALQEVNQTFRLHNTASSVSDAMIGAVAKLAVFEALFGDARAFRRHMTGLSEMIALRQKNELTAGALDGFVRKLVFWIDLNASYLTGTPRTFGKDDAMLMMQTDIREPNPIAFAGTTKAVEMLRSGRA